jgi:hypothetical protein
MEHQFCSYVCLMDNFIEDANLKKEKKKLPSIKVSSLKTDSIFK